LENLKGVKVPTEEELQEINMSAEDANETILNIKSSLLELKNTKIDNIVKRVFGNKSSSADAKAFKKELQELYGITKNTT
jgi:hypothetical protein